MQNSNWHRIYFNGQTALLPDEVPTRLNICIDHLDQSPSTVALQVEQSSSWKGGSWKLVPPKALTKLLQLACQALARQQNQLSEALGLPLSTRIPFEHKTLDNRLLKLWLGLLRATELSEAKVSDPWSCGFVSNLQGEAAPALRAAIVTMLKTKIKIARAQGLKDNVRTEDLIARIKQRTCGGERTQSEEQTSVASPHAKGAFFGDRLRKFSLLEQLRAHREANQLVQSSFIWSGDFGSATGCTIHSEDLSLYQSQLGIPVVLAYLKEFFFQIIPQAEDAQKFPEEFLSAIKPGSDLSDVWVEFVNWLILDPQNGLVSLIEVGTSGADSTENQRMAYHELAKLLGRRERDQMAWKQVSGLIQGLAQRFKSEALGTTLSFASKAASTIAEQKVIDVDALPFDAVIQIVKSLVTAKVDRAYTGSGPNSPGREHFFDLYYDRAIKKFLELLASAPVAA
ncbi:MAG: hypothetical protein K2W82_16945 [Candidatus Obscuribacterales bacterium]|nr:hypothetical protein [Candidatus Obscuribacterales bacterium]